MNRTPRFRTWTAAIAMGTIAVSPATLTACTPSEDVAAETCADIVHEAAYEAEVADEIRGFDNAIRKCGSYDELRIIMESYDRLVGYSVPEFLSRRCRDAAEELGDTAVCTVANPATTIAQNPTDLSYSGATLDGQVVTVTPDEVEFEGSVPKVIANTVALADQGCLSVLNVRDEYAAQVDDSREGQIRSMYAQHAQSVADFIGCVSQPVTGTTAVTEPPG